MKRTTLKRRTPLARGAGPKRQPMKRYRKPSAVAKADAMAAAIVHARGRCAVAVAVNMGVLIACCGRLEQHHARGRGKGFRWRTESHLLLCERHHRYGPFSAHGTPAQFKEWLRYTHPEILAMPNVPETAEEAIARMTNNKAHFSEVSDSARRIK